MGIFGIGEGKGNDTEQETSVNEEVVKSVVLEIKEENSPEINTTVSQDTENVDVDNPERDIKVESDIKAKEGLKEMGEVYRRYDSKTRERINLIMGAAFATLMLTSCGKVERNNSQVSSGTENSKTPETLVIPGLPKGQNVEMQEFGKEFFVGNFTRLNSNDFIIGVEGYPNAIVDRSPFASNDRGEPLFLRYSGGQFDEVTYLHYTGEKTPVVGEILPVMFKVPEDIGNLELDLIPYAISVKSERAKIKFNDGKNHYLVPIVTSGNSTGIVDIIKNGEIVNGIYKSFEVKPDNVSGLTKGYLSFVVLTEIGNELVVEGVIEHNNNFFVDRDNIPEEISSLMGE